MKRLQIPLLASLLFLMITTTGCEAIGDIFKAGMWVGIIVVVAIVALIMWLAGKAKR